MQKTNIAMTQNTHPGCKPEQILIAKFIYPAKISRIFIATKPRSPYSFSMLKNGILLLLLFLFTSCGKFQRIEDGGFTTVTFSAPNAPSSAVMPGGILVYAYSQSFVTNFKIATEADMQGKSIILPNGLYSFYAFGYADGSTMPDANVKCAVEGHNLPVPLDGGARSISLNLTDTQCALGAFAPNSSYTANTGANSANFAKVSFLHCGPGAASAANTFASTSFCGPAQSNYSWFSGLYSARVNLPIFRRDGTSFTRLGDGITGQCRSDTNPGSSDVVFARVPAGAADRPGLFPIEIEAFAGSNCSNYLTKHIFNDGYQFGPKSPSPNLNYKIVQFASQGENLLKYFLIAN